MIRRARALELYEGGLAIDLRQPTLLCEAGWAAFWAKDPRAEQLLIEGADLSPFGAMRGACLYNLGRVYERNGDSARATRAYADSLGSRPDNGETQRRYRAVAGEDWDPDMCPPAGPFDDVAVFVTRCGTSTRRAVATLRPRKVALRRRRSGARGARGRGRAGTGRAGVHDASSIAKPRRQARAARAYRHQLLALVLEWIRGHRARALADAGRRAADRRASRQQ